MAQKSVPSFIEEVVSLPGGAKINECIQCGTCSGSCTTVERWEYTPRRIISMVRAGMKEEVLSSDSIWYCATCYLCTVRCPRDIKPTEIMYALQNLAIREGFKPKTARTPTLYRTFVEVVREKGRFYEFGFLFRYFRRTNLLAALQRLPLALTFFRHGQLSLRPSEVKRKQEIKTLLERVKQIEGEK